MPLRSPVLPQAGNVERYSGDPVQGLLARVRQMLDPQIKPDTPFTVVGAPLPSPSALLSPRPWPAPRCPVPEAPNSSQALAPCFLSAPGPAFILTPL